MILLTMITRFDITPRQIDETVVVFYAAIRRHPVLGPVFARHVEDWPTHEAKIACFWKKTILMEPGYDGNPMQAHRHAADVRAEHFPQWLALFDETLQRTLPAQTAAAWSALAHRIGRGLRIGVEEADAAAGAPPVLRYPRVRGGRGR